MTAVEWLEVKLDNIGLNSDIIGDYIQQAKELEKQQIVDAYDLGMGHYGGANRRSDAEQYYTETFKNK